MFVAEAVFIAMVAICSLLTECRQLAFSRAHHEKSTPEPFKRAEKTGLTRAAKIAAERHSAELRHLTQPDARLLAQNHLAAGKVQESRMAEGRNPIELVIIDDNPRSLEYISTALASDRREDLYRA